MAGMSRISAMFTADTSGLSAGTKQAAASLRGMAGDVAALKRSMSTLTGINAAQLFGQITSGVIGAAKAFAGLASDSAGTIDTLSKMAARLGVSYEEMSGLSLAAELAGVSVNTLAGAMTKTDRAFIEAQRGSKTATDAFARIGLSIDQLGNLDAAGRFDAIADAISQLPSPAERSAAAIALFGKSGAELLPLFQQGANGIRESAEWAQRLGVSLSTVQGQNVEKMNDSWTLVQTSLKGIVQVITAELSPAITAINEAWLGLFSADGVASIAGTITTAFWDAAEILARGMDFVSYAFTPVLEAWNAATAWLGEVIGAWTGTIDWWSVAVETFQRAVSLLQGVGSAFIGGFQAIVGSLAKVGSWLVGGIARGVEALGYESKGLRDAQRGLDSFAKARFDSAFKWGDTAGELTANAFSRNFQATELGVKLANGFGGGAEAAVEKLRRGRDELVEGGNRVAEEVKGVGRDVAAAFSTKLASAVDVRSKEGVKEMLRLMYGGGDNVEDQQLAAQQDMVGLLGQVVDNTSDLGLEVAPL